MTVSLIQSNIRTLGEVLSAMAPFAGGSIPNIDDTEYTDWLRWVNQKQEEYARRAFWRRCLTREVITLLGETTYLPLRFHKPNGIWVLEVDGVDWKETPNDDEQYVFVEMENDTTATDGGTPAVSTFGRWKMRFENEVKTSTTARLWYFANPPKVNAESDILLLPGDMIAYGALQEYYRTTGAQGSEDKVEELAENRFAEYLGLEVLPDKGEVLRNSENTHRVDRLEIARGYYKHRAGRNTY